MVRDWSGAPRHFLQTADHAGIGRQVVESVIQELLDGAASTVDSVVSAAQQLSGSNCLVYRGRNQGETSALGGVGNCQLSEVVWRRDCRLSRQIRAYEISSVVLVTS